MLEFQRGDESSHFDHDKNKEVREKIPDSIEVCFWFGVHSTKEDVDKMDSAFRECDIFIPECAGWDKKYQEELELLSKSENPIPAYFERDGQIYILVPNEYNQAVEDMVKNSHKVIIMIDVEKGELFNKYGMSESGEFFLENRAMSHFYRGDFNKTIALLKELCEKQLEYNNAREHIMIQKFKENFFDKNKLLQLASQPELQGKKTWKILIQLGAAHTRVFHQLKSLESGGIDFGDDQKIDIQVQRKMDSPSQNEMYPPSVVLIRKFLFNKEIDTDDTLSRYQKYNQLSEKEKGIFHWVRKIMYGVSSQGEVPYKNNDEYFLWAIIGNCCYTLFSTTLKEFSSEDQIFIIWYICYSFTWEDIQNICKQLGKNSTSKDYLPVLESEFTKYLNFYKIPSLKSTKNAKEILQRAFQKLKNMPERAR